MKSVNVVEAKELMERNAKDVNFEIIDVRNHLEYKEGHLHNSRLLPVDEIYEWSQTLKKNKTYLICCRSGARSAMAANFLGPYGIKAINMEGGILDWQKMNFKIEK